MGAAKLTKHAAAAFEDLFLWSHQQFGAYQAEAYAEGLKRSFELLADFPLIGQRVDELATDLRRFRFQSHHIYYRVDGDGVLILALIHVRQDLRDALFD